MRIKKIYTCGKCGGECDPARDTFWNGRYWHVECPERTFERIMRELEDES